MSAFTFDFDLEDDLDESCDAPKLRVPPINAVPASEGTEQPAEEIPLSELVRTPGH
jgi:hypothetical protein